MFRIVYFTNGSEWVGVAKVSGRDLEKGAWLERIKLSNPFY